VLHHDATVLEDALTQQLRRLVDEDDVDAPARREPGERRRDAREQRTARPLMGGHRQDGHVQIAVRTRTASRTGAEHRQGPDPVDVRRRAFDLLVECLGRTLHRRSPDARVET